MPFEKGKSGNANGRPKGSGNKVSVSVKSWLSGLIDKNRKQIEKDLQSLEPLERLKILEKLLSYIIPKEAAIHKDINFEQMSDDELQRIVDKLTGNEQ